MTTYAAYTDDGIWATGATPQKAIDTFCREGRIDQEDYEREFGPFETAPITPRLAAYIDEHGFDCQRDTYRILSDGTLDMEPTVQMVDATRAAEGYIEYRGDAEPLEAWIDSLTDYDAEEVSDNLMGWGEYTHLVKLTGYDKAGEYPLYYLVTDEAMPYVRRETAP